MKLYRNYIETRVKLFETALYIRDKVVSSGINRYIGRRTNETLRQQILN